MKKTIEFGKVDARGTGRRSNLVTVTVELKTVTGQHKRTIDLEPITNYVALSIVGDVWNHIHTDIICGGQCQDTLAELLPDDEKLQRVIEVWNRWHLNDLMPGTRAQMEVASGLPYIEALRVLDKAGLRVDRGYEYGSEWLVEVLPQNIIEEVMSW